MSLDTKFLERFAQAASKEGITDVVYGRVSTKIGDLVVAQTDKGLCRVAFSEEDDDEVIDELAERIGARIVESQGLTKDVRETLTRYLAGSTTTLDMPVDMRLVAAPFQKKVLTTLRRVPRGSVTTYGQLASRIGHPGAARATGTALGKNPIPIVVPCHRVIQGTGRIGGYGGQPWRKEFLLRLEGALD
jgi:methylated-DNA-[protein]-cysteine S-methyltransferase